MTGRWVGVRGKYGEPCEECGRRKRYDPEVARKRLAAGGYTGFKKGDPKQREIAKKGQEARQALYGRRTFTQELHEVIREAAENVVRPYVKGLELRPPHDASPRSKLRFYLDQMQISEAVMNRLDGTPVQRTRQVNKEDEDVLPIGALTDMPQVAIDKILVAISTGDAEQLLTSWREPVPIRAPE